MDRRGKVWNVIFVYLRQWGAERARRFNTCRETAQPLSILHSRQAETCLDPASVGGAEAPFGSLTLTSFLEVELLHSTKNGPGHGGF